MISSTFCNSFFGISSPVIAIFHQEDTIAWTAALWKFHPSLRMLVQCSGPPASSELLAVFSWFPCWCARLLWFKLPLASFCSLQSHTAVVWQMWHGWDRMERNTRWPWSPAVAVWIPVCSLTSHRVNKWLCKTVSKFYVNNRGVSLSTEKNNSIRFYVKNAWKIL